MSNYLVNQGKTYRYEHNGGYLWSQKFDARDRPNTGYTLMNSVKLGEFILHNSVGKLSAISVEQQRETAEEE